MVRQLVLASALLMAALFLPVPAAAESHGVIEGRLVNGTGGERPVTGADVGLFSVKGDVEQPVKSTTTDAEGRFKFEGLPTGDEYTYIVFTRHAGVEYLTGRIRLTDAAPAQEVGLTVYETTHNDSAVRVRSASVALLEVDKTTQRVPVLETFLFENRGDRTFLPTTTGPKGPMGLLRFSLPPGAEEVSPMGELANHEVIQTDRGFGTNAPLRPGVSELTFRYSIPYTEQQSTYSFSLTMPYSTQQLRLLSPEDGPPVSAPLLQDAGTTSLWGASYRVMSAQDLTARTKLEVTLTDLPVNLWTIRPGNPLLPAGAAGLLLALLLGAFLLHRRDARRGRAEPRTEQDALVESIAELDEEYESGRLDEQSYRREREIARQRLLALMASAQPEA